MAENEAQEGPSAADHDPRTWFTGENLRVLIHRAEYGESVADNIARGRRLYGKIAGAAALYARALLPALRELEKARKETEALRGALAVVMSDERIAEIAAGRSETVVCLVKQYREQVEAPLRAEIAALKAGKLLP